ncbi:MAG: hypothetical protein EOM26_06955 [Alphaproteobacteria bacterium]|nr:hypothetical protein [Alphaproteobacteria bacterium]
MFEPGEIKRNLLGSLEVALFMPQAAKRFSSSYEAMLRSFIVPVLLFPASAMLVFLEPELDGIPANWLSLVLSLRIWICMAAFIGIVWLICKHTDRKQHFCQFVTASNWLSVPATVAALPILAFLGTGAYSWAEMELPLIAVGAYTYAFTGYMAAVVLRIPIELGWFVAIMGMMIDDSSLEVSGWVHGLIG